MTNSLIPRHRLLPLVVFLALVCSSAAAQDTPNSPQQARETEWQNYRLPETNFRRLTTSDKEFLFRVPSDWKQPSGELTFEGPHTAQLKIYVEKIPDGFPLPDYVNALVRNLRGTPGAAAVLSRRTQIQDIETREISLEAPNAEGELTPTVFWVAVRGPQAIAFILITPVAHAAEIEPYYKALIHSVRFLSKFEYADFESKRLTAIKSSAPAPLHEIDAIETTLDQVTDRREAAIVKLGAIFASTPDLAIDLVIDRRPLIRAAAVAAITLSKNVTLSEFLWRAVGDHEPLVAEHAAKAVANLPNVIAKLAGQSFEGFHTQTIARVWQSLDKEKRVQLLQEIFSRTSAERAPPPPWKNPKSKERVEVSVTKLTPVDGKKPKTEFIAFASMWSTDPSVQLGALTLLATIPVSEFKLPLARIAAADHDPLTAAALQVSLARNEALPTETLFKLVAASNERVRNLAAQSLALSASVSDIPRVESLIAKATARTSSGSAANAEKPPTEYATIADELKLTIKKLKFRDQLATAGKDSSNARQDVIKKGLADPQLAYFVWQYFGPEPPAPREIPSDFSIKPMAENLLPERLEHFVVLPNPAQATQRFYETLQGIQMESARSQMSLVLAMSGIRQVLGQQLGAVPNAPSIIEFTGIKTDAPISLASWIPESAPGRIDNARRQAVILKVADRTRLEQTVQTYQGIVGSFGALPDYFAIGSRSFAALPAILPLSARTLLSSAQPVSKESKILNYSLVRSIEFNAIPVKTIEQRQVYSDGRIDFTITYLAYLGETAILTPDLASMKELLDRAGRNDAPTLANNSEFQRVVAGGGDVIYFSDLESLFQRSGEQTSEAKSANLREAGALRFAKAAWENSHHLSFNESDWSKPLQPFHPKELTAPADLLPNSTLAYAFVKVDLKSAWTAWAKRLWNATDMEVAVNPWALNFENEVLPELGPECGAVLLNLPDITPNDTNGTWALFCKLKSAKLETAIATGKLFQGVKATNAVVELKLGADNYFVTTRSGFLVVSNHATGLEQLNQKGKLASARDYARAAEKVPASIVAFGGYNLEAAVAAVKPNDEKGTLGERATFIASLAGAFHNQNFYASVTSGSLAAQSSVAMDRQGRYSVAELLSRPRGSGITYATIEPRGLPLGDSKSLSSLEVRIRTRTAGAVERIKEDISSTEQVVEQKSAEELIVKVAARRSTPPKMLLPITDATMAAFLQSTREFPTNDPQVLARAREIVGEDRDAWSVARKLADWTHKNLEWKFTANADAAQTLATREADCSEFSQLFVAMARSVGLPARLVSGLAYGGSSFGGHAWVEVWIGRWMELDPTWGTDYVDATHIRNASGALLTYGALDLIELEVLAAAHSVADFQRSPKSLAEELSKSISAGESGILETALDLPVLTDELMGQASWATMNDSERDQLSSAYRRVLFEITLGYKDDAEEPAGLRILRVSETGDRAEALCLTTSNVLVKMRLMRLGKVWYLTEILQVDTDLSIVAETMRPALQTIEDRRAGRKPRLTGTSDFVRVLLMLDKDAGKAVELADRLLKDNAGNQRILYVKALALIANETTADEGEKLLGQLAAESVRKPFIPAVYRLATRFNHSEDEVERKTAVQMFERYVALEPFDPRGHLGLAAAYDSIKQVAAAEAAYRKAIDCDPENSVGYLSLIAQLLSQDRFIDVATVLAEGEKRVGSEDDLFGSVMSDLHSLEDLALAKRFAASQPERMNSSVNANIYLAWSYIEGNLALEALPLLKRAALLDRKSVDPLLVMAEAYRKLARWKAALDVSDQALVMDSKSAYAHYQRACALARLRRTQDAMAALNRAVELEPFRVHFIKEEKDLQALKSIPAFQKLIEEASKEQ